MLVVSSPWGAPGSLFHVQAAPQPNFQQSYAFTDDFDGHATIRVEPCPNCDGECGNEYVVLRIAGHPDADRDPEIVWDKEEAKRIAAAILRAANVIPAPNLN
jgi:hypothetical protein